jgi:hypothetical protein
MDGPGFSPKKRRLLLTSQAAFDFFNETLRYPRNESFHTTCVPESEQLWDPLLHPSILKT